MCRGAAPRVILCPPHQPCPYGIPFYIPYGRPQMLFIQRAGKITPLPQSAAYSLNPIDVLGIAEVHRLKHLGKGIGPSRHTDKVDVVGHQTIGQRLQAMLGRIFEEELKITLTVTIVEEHIFTAIAPLRQMVRKSGHNDPCHSRHELMVAMPRPMSR